MKFVVALLIANATALKLSRPHYNQYQQFATGLTEGEVDQMN